MTTADIGALITQAAQRESEALGIWDGPNAWVAIRVWEHHGDPEMDGPGVAFFGIFETLADAQEGCRGDREPTWTTTNKLASHRRVVSEVIQLMHARGQIQFIIQETPMYAATKETS